ncbi:putative transposable element [Phytophthora palmivora]|uniref:Transposable element n=1 Tax=Phytophthora palmivora TaxID=4796 RepID=A0A2P4Y7A5_9STRA|nr:putative transposable element [Phytophthora palmivora]
MRPRAYCDANWGGDKQSRRSTSVVLAMLGGGVVVYKCKRKNFSRVIFCRGRMHVTGVDNTSNKMGMATDQATTINLDNKSAISIATNQGYTPKAKISDLRAHFVHDHVEQGNIKLHQNNIRLHQCTSCAITNLRAS